MEEEDRDGGAGVGLGMGVPKLPGVEDPERTESRGGEML